MSVYEVLELILLPLLITALLALPVYAAVTKKKSGKSKNSSASRSGTSTVRVVSSIIFCTKCAAISRLSPNSTS